VARKFDAAHHSIRGISISWDNRNARNSTMVYMGEAVYVKQIGREQGVRYVLEGSARKGGDRVRVTA